MHCRLRPVPFRPFPGRDVPGFLAVCFYAFLGLYFPMPSADPNPPEPRRNLLFVTMAFPSFIREDLELLSGRFRVRTFLYRPSRNLLPNAWRQIRLALWLAARIRRADAVVVWFADYHAPLPVWFGRRCGKRSVIVLAGYDVARIPELKYGVFSNPVRSFCARYAIRNASVLAPVTPSLAEKAERRTGPVRGRIVPIPFGFDASAWTRTEASPKENEVLTVGFAESETRIRIKGMDLLVEAAWLLPSVPFTVVGVSAEAVRALHPPPNVRWVEKLPRENLRSYYSRAKVYAQLSVSEGMPNVLCEAMLCECVPVGTAVGGIPDVIGDCGFLVRTRTPEAAAEAIRWALAAPPELGLSARRRIVENFTPERRASIWKDILPERPGPGDRAGSHEGAA
jgi:glycosyltransferase involved in cell wall biosynthesis